MKSVIIIGASSGIGAELAECYARAGWKTGITARRVEELNIIQRKHPDLIYTQHMDVTQTDEAVNAFQTLTKAMDIIPDLVILNAGVGNNNREYDLDKELFTIDVNVRGFIALMQCAYTAMKPRGYGHIAGISSVTTYFGYGRSAAYNASKTCISNYMSGIRHKAMIEDWDLTVSDIRPGFINTPMIENRDVFLSIDADRAADYIFKALEHKKRRAHIPARWFWISQLIKLLPERLLHRALT